jgi:hypothetical protein
MLNSVLLSVIRGADWQIRRFATENPWEDNTMTRRLRFAFSFLALAAAASGGNPADFEPLLPGESFTCEMTDQARSFLLQDPFVDRVGNEVVVSWRTFASCWDSPTSDGGDRW